ncbi:MAG: CDP-diacylglycerol--glycerol-3-phosphate 3-phosphatidyltransferase [Clostridia bacterium]|nr:CDP-diacylglycerol--glycerol-3-phosphate 3-phosphatidyltransferase [Clostridia bacterium]
MNLPNKLTVLRIILTPIFMLSLVWQFPYHYIVALFVFIFASLTDFFDGKIARQQGIVTDFGKFLDPLADKMLTTSAFLGFIALGIGDGAVWIAFIVLFREFLVSSLRLVAVSSGGKVIAANIWGKLKTVTQMIAIIYAIAAEQFIQFVDIPVLTLVLRSLTTVFLWISAVICIISGAIYLIDNIKFINSSK